jgi:hypothetical protein
MARIQGNFPMTDFQQALQDRHYDMFRAVNKPPWPTDLLINMRKADACEPRTSAGLYFPQDSTELTAEAQDRHFARLSICVYLIRHGDRTYMLEPEEEPTMADLSDKEKLREFMDSDDFKMGNLLPEGAVYTKEAYPNAYVCAEFEL